MSTNAALSVAAVALLLVSVIVRTLVPPTAIDAGANAFATVGALAVTVKLAVAAAALLPLFVCNPPAAMVFVTVPGVLLVTLAVIVQVPGAPPGIVAPEAYVTVVPPATPLTEATVQVPPNVALASVTPAGNVSTSAAPSVAAVALLFESVIVRTLVPPDTIDAGAKDLATVGALAVTVKLAVAAAALLPLLVCNAPAAMVLVTVPGVLLVTLAVMVQVPGAPPGIVAPDAYVTVLPPATPLLAPVQVPPNVAFASVTPAGNVSTSAALNVAAVALLLVSVIVRTLVPPDTIEAGAKALATVGTLAVTVRLAVAAAALLPLLVCNAPAAIVLVTVPGVPLVTFAVMLQEPGAPPGIVAPEA